MGFVDRLDLTGEFLVLHVSDAEFLGNPCNGESQNECGAGPFHFRAHYHVLYVW